MRNTILIFVILCFAVSCKPSKKELPVENDITLKPEIDSILTNWHKAASDANFENYFSKMDSISVFIGTDAGENWTKQEFEKFSKPYFDKGKAWSFTTLERNIYTSKSSTVVWFDELLDTWMGICRGSGVLEKNNDTWEIKQYVLSITIPNSDVNAVVNVKKETDVLLLKTFKD